MKRDNQIRLLDTCKVRAEARVKTWHADPRVQAIVNADHVAVKLLKASRRQKLASPALMDWTGPA